MQIKNHGENKRMALINCPECNREISDKAEACPHCGFPVAKLATPLTPKPTQNDLPNSVECLDCLKDFPFHDEVCPHCGLFNSRKYKYLQPEVPEVQKINITKDEVCCPKCSSAQIAAGNKGFGLGKAAAGGLLLGPVGLLGGLIGSKKTTVTCLKCGHKWNP
jgi:ribosomal protein L37E